MTSQNLIFQCLEKTRAQNSDIWPNGRHFGDDEGFPKWKRLFAGTLMANKNLFAGDEKCKSSVILNLSIFQTVNLGLRSLLGL